jgi:L-seryl-tRNA(Ser) seleniumtransferase
MTVDELSKRLRTGTPAVVGRIQQDRLLLDLRSVLPHQDSAIVDAVGRIETTGKTNASVESM